MVSKFCSFYLNHAFHFISSVHVCWTKLRKRLNPSEVEEGSEFQQTPCNTLQEPVWPNLFSQCSSAWQPVLVSPKGRLPCPHYYQSRLPDPATAVFSRFYQQCWTRWTPQEACRVTPCQLWRETAHTLDSAALRKMALFCLNKINTIWLGIFRSPQTSTQQPGRQEAKAGLATHQEADFVSAELEAAIYFPVVLILFIWVSFPVSLLSLQR